MINSTNGETSFVSVKEKAWHGLGHIVDEAMTSDEAIKFGGLDYQVDSQNVIYQNPQTGELEELQDKFVNVRQDTGDALGVVGSKYQIIQNRDAFDFFDAIVGEGEAVFETAGALGKGERIFVTAKLPNHIRVAGEEIEEYLFLYNSHDASGAIVAAFTPIRIVCNNTLNAALRNNRMKVSIRHTVSAKKQLEMAYKLMGITNQLHDDLSDVFGIMAKKQVSDSNLNYMIVETIGGMDAVKKVMSGEGLTTRSQNMVDDIFEYALENETQQQESVKGTLFGAYNAVTGYFQNEKEYTSNEKALISVTEGTGHLYGQKMFNLCMDKIN